MASSRHSPPLQVHSSGPNPFPPVAARWAPWSCPERLWRPLEARQGAGTWFPCRCSQTSAETLTANHLATGALAWSLHGLWQIQRGNLGGTAGGHLYVTNPAGAVVGLNPATGTTQYTLSAATTVLAVDNAKAYADCGSLGVCAYSTATGTRLWSAQPGLAPGLAAEAGGVLYMDQGLALNSSTGQAITSLWNGTATALVIGDGRIASVTDPRVLDLFGMHGS